MKKNNLVIIAIIILLLFVFIRKKEGFENIEVMNVYNPAYPDADDKCSSSGDTITTLFSEKLVGFFEGVPIISAGYPRDVLGSGKTFESATLKLFHDRGGTGTDYYFDVVVSNNKDNPACDYCMNWNEAWNVCDIDDNSIIIAEYQLAPEPGENRYYDITSELQSAYDNNKYFAVYIDTSRYHPNYQWYTSGPDNSEPSERPTLEIIYSDCNTDADGMYTGACDGCVDSNEWISNGALDSWYYQSVDPDNGKMIDDIEWPAVQSAWYYQTGCSS